MKPKHSSITKGTVEATKMSGVVQNRINIAIGPIRLSTSKKCEMGAFC